MISLQEPNLCTKLVGDIICVINEKQLECDLKQTKEGKKNSTVENLV